jgi:hypothetical protein
MRCVAAFLLILALVGCGSTQATRRQPTPQDAPVDFLLTSAASDFHTHGQLRPERFRDVRVGYFPAADGERRYMLSGEFMPAQQGGKDEWIPFVTLKTSGYEQWIGAQATAFSQRSSITWLDGDLSSSLQKKLDSLR